MHSPSPLPVCFVIGRDDRSFRILSRRLGSRATFIQSSEAECLSSRHKTNLDLAVVLWSSTARTCAQTIHQQHPNAKIILEQNCSNLSGLGEKNGFLSVIERSQSQSVLLEQVEAALNEWNQEVDIPMINESLFQPHTAIARLASIPMVNGDRQRLADNLLDLFLNATQSGAGGLFLLETEKTGFVASSFRNLPYQVNTARIARTSKLACLLASQSSPIEIFKESKNSTLHLVEKQLGCNLIFPLRTDGLLQGWIMLQTDRRLTDSDKSSLTSLTFFAAEMVKQSHASLLATQRIEQNLNIVTKVTEALARIKPDGEIEIIHDAKQLIVLRGKSDRAHYERLASSVLKQTIHEAQDRSRDRRSFIQTRQGKSIDVNLHRLPDQSHILHLATESAEPLKVGREMTLWRALALESLEKLKHAEGHLAQELRLTADMWNGIQKVFQAQLNEEQPCSEIHRLLSGLVQDPMDLEEARRWHGKVLSTLASTTILLTGFSVRRRMGRSSVRVSLSERKGPQMLLQLDMVRGQDMQSPDADALEAIAAAGCGLARITSAFLQAAFGYRWEFACSITPKKEAAQAQKIEARIGRTESLSVVQLDTFVLQESQNPIKYLDDWSKERTVEISRDLCPAENARADRATAG